MKKRILESLKRGSLSTKEIAEAIGMSNKEASVRTKVNQLFGSSKVIKVGDKWGLPMV